MAQNAIRDIFQSMMKHVMSIQTTVDPSRR